jgi:ribosome maturation factor RimP
MIDKQHIINLIEDRIRDDNDIFIVSVTVSSRNDINVVLDGDNGLNINRCIEVSRQIEQNLDRENEDFSLEVGTFPLGGALKMKRQYFKYIDKNVAIVLNDSSSLKGILRKMDENEVILEQELTKKKIKEGVDPMVKIPFSTIKETRALIVF